MTSMSVVKPATLSLNTFCISSFLHFFVQCFPFRHVPLVELGRVVHLELQREAFGIFIVMGQDAAQPWLAQQARCHGFGDVSLAYPNHEIAGIVKAHVVGRIVD